MQFVIFACALAAANAGLLGLQPTIGYQQAPLAYAAGPSYPSIQSPSLTSQSSNILRSYGNLGQIATQQKTIQTPFSSQTRSDIRVSNPGLQYAGYAAAPALAYAAGPAPLAPLAAAPQAGLLGVAYSPANVVSHMVYSAPAITYTY